MVTHLNKQISGASVRFLTPATWSVFKPTMRQDLWMPYLLFGHSVFVKQLAIQRWWNSYSVGYGSNNNMLMIREREGVDGLPFWSHIFIRGYYLQSSIFWVWVMRVLHQKNLASLPMFEIVFSANNHQCCVALSYIATPVSYCNLCCITEILCCLNGITISVLRS